jgi:hypothetical protein
MMAERRIRIVHRGKAMHKRGRPERGFARIANIEKGREIAREFL